MIRLFLTFIAMLFFYGSTEAEANVCGSGVSRFLVPDFVGFDANGSRISYQDVSKTKASGLRSVTVSFVAACKMHDKCYGTPGTRKSECDSIFYRELKSACRLSLPRTVPRQMSRSCIETALLYNDVVRGQEARREDLWGALSSRFTGQSGCNAYREAQKNKKASCE